MSDLCYHCRNRKGGYPMEETMPMRPVEIDRFDDEQAVTHRDPAEEMMFYRAVASGALNEVQENCSSGVFEDTQHMGHLSDDPVMNLKYHFVVTAAMITRFCLEPLNFPIKKLYKKN